MDSRLVELAIKQREVEKWHDGLAQLRRLGERSGMIDISLKRMSFLDVVCVLCVVFFAEKCSTYVIRIISNWISLGCWCVGFFS